MSDRCLKHFEDQVQIADTRGNSCPYCALELANQQVNVALQQMDEVNKTHVKALGEIHRLRDRLQNRIRLCPCKRGDCKTCLDDMKEL